MDDPNTYRTYYSDYSEEEMDEAIALSDEGQYLANLVGAYIEKLQANPKTDKRWVAIGKTGLQQGFMAAIRGVVGSGMF